MFRIERRELLKCPEKEGFSTKQSEPSDVFPGTNFAMPIFPFSGRQQTSHKTFW